LAPGAARRNVDFASQVPPCPATQKELQLETVTACWAYISCLSFPSCKRETAEAGNH